MYYFMMILHSMVVITSQFQVTGATSAPVNLIMSNTVLFVARNQAVGVGTPRYQTMLTFEPSQDGVFTPRDALSASLAVIGCIRAMHYSGLIYGHIRVDTLKDGKVGSEFQASPSFVYSQTSANQPRILTINKYTRTEAVKGDSFLCLFTDKGAV